MTARLLSTFLAGHPAHQLVFLRLHQVDRQFLFAALRDFYAESEMNVTRIVDIAQDLKALDDVLSLRPFVLALDLAALASRREYLNLDKWLATQMQQHGAQLVRATLEFVGHKVQHELRRQEMDNAPEPTTLALNAATIAVFMRVLRAQCVLVSLFPLPPRALASLKEIAVLTFLALSLAATSSSRATTSSCSRRCGPSACNCTRAS